MGKARTRAQKLAEKRERRKLMGMQAPKAANTPQASAQAVTEPRNEAIRPTPERRAKGSFRMPKGQLRHTMPAHDEAHDTIAKLHRAGLISDAQESSARDWQRLKADVRAELGINQGRSCLDISPIGHDDSEGDPELMARWREIEAELGSWKVGCLDWTCVLGHPPANLDLFRSALNAFGRA